MRISRRKRHHIKKPQGVFFRANENIRVPEVRVVDENGENLGLMQTWKARQMAEERGLDLVEISSKAVPPVVKFLEYGQFKYEKEKELKKQKTKQQISEVKCIRLSPRIDKHDLEIRKEKAIEFLNRGDKVQIEVILRGREKQFTFAAKDMVNNFIANIKANNLDIKVEQPVSSLGGKISALISKK